MFCSTHSPVPESQRLLQMLRTQASSYVCEPGGLSALLQSRAQGPQWTHSRFRDLGIWPSSPALLHLWLLPSSPCPLLCNENQRHAWLTISTVVINLSHILRTKATSKIDLGKYRVGLWHPWGEAISSTLPHNKHPAYWNTPWPWIYRHHEDPRL